METKLGLHVSLVHRNSTVLFKVIRGRTLSKIRGLDLERESSGEREREKVGEDWVWSSKPYFLLQALAFVSRENPDSSIFSRNLGFS